MPETKNKRKARNIVNHGDHILTAKILTNAECKKIIKFYKENQHLSKKTDYGDGQNTKSIGIQVSSLKNEPGAKEIDNIIFGAVGKMITTLCDELPVFKDSCLNGIGDSGYNIRKVYGETRQHQDGPEINSKNWRVGTIIISLHTSGDSVVFPSQNLELEFTEGTAVFFPPYWTHPHYTKFNEKETYRIQTWLTNTYNTRR